MIHTSKAGSRGEIGSSGGMSPTALFDACTSLPPASQRVMLSLTREMHPTILGFAPKPPPLSSISFHGGLAKTAAGVKPGPDAERFQLSFLFLYQVLVQTTDLKEVQLIQSSPPPFLVYSLLVACTTSQLIRKGKAHGNGTTNDPVPGCIRVVQQNISQEANKGSGVFNTQSNVRA